MGRPQNSSKSKKTVVLAAGSRQSARKARVVKPELVESDILEPELISAEVVDTDADSPEVSDSSDDVLEFDDLVESELPTLEKTRKNKTTDTDLSLPVLATKRALSPTDPLKQYLNEVSKYPLLSPEEEMKWAQRLRETGDIEAARALVQANLRLVVKIAFEYRSVYANVMDLIQEGNMGLMKAISKYDLSKGARFGYYSSWWIRSYILKYLLDNFRLVRVGTTQAQKKLFFHLMQERERLEAQGILPAPKLIADRLNVREKDVIEMQGRLGPSSGDVSLDAERPSSDGSPSTSLKSKLMDHGTSPEDLAIDSQGVELLKKRLPAFKKTLNGKELSILEERLLAEEPKTLQEVADKYSLTRERARQIETKVLSKLKEFIDKQSV